MMEMMQKMEMMMLMKVHGDDGDGSLLLWRDAALLL